MLLHEAFFCSTRPYLPDDDAELWSLADCDSLDEWSLVKNRVRPMFIEVVIDGVKLLKNKRVCADWDHVQSIRRKNQTNALARWNTAAEPPGETGDGATALRSHATALPNDVSQCKEVKEVSNEVREGPRPEAKARRTLQGSVLASQALAFSREPYAPNDSAALPLEASAAIDTPLPSSAAPSPRKAKAAPSGQLGRAIEVWNRNCGDCLPKVRGGSESRRAKLKSRIEEAENPEVFFADFEQAVRLCAATPFLLGENKRGWRPDFDWLTANDENLTKVLEGKYGSVKPRARVYTDPNELYSGPEYCEPSALGGAQCAN